MSAKSLYVLAHYSFLLRIKLYHSFLLNYIVAGETGIEPATFGFGDHYLS